MSRKRLISLALAVLLLPAGCATVKPAPAGELAVLDRSLTKLDSGGIEVQVEVKNVGASTIELAQVKVNLYNEQDVLLDVLSDGIMNLKPNETWVFKFLVAEADCQDWGEVTRYDIEAMAGTSSGGG